MKIKVVRNCAIVSSIILLTGCTTSDFSTILSDGSVVSTSTKKIKPTQIQSVKLYYGNQNLPKGYRVIGHATADHYSFAAIPHSQETISEELKKQAASIGGTGVINITTGLDRTSGDVIR